MKVGPFYLKYKSRRCWFLYFRNTFLARYTTISKHSRFKFSCGPLVVEWW